MERLNVIPYPNKVEFTSGTLKREKLEGVQMPVNLVEGSMGEEEYRIVITEDGITTDCATLKGAFYARQTLNQLITEE